MIVSDSGAARLARAGNTVAAWVVGLVWILPLAYAVWTAFHPSAFSTRFELGAPLTLQNFADAWHAEPERIRAAGARSRGAKVVERLGGHRPRIGRSSTPRPAMAQFP